MYDFKENEQRILKFWNERIVYIRLLLNLYCVSLSNIFLAYLTLDSFIQILNYYPNDKEIYFNLKDKLLFEN